MSKRIKKISAFTLSLGCLVMLLALPAFAANDNYPFSFKMKNNGNRNYTEDTYYRQSTNVKEHWKVQMTFSSEGVGTTASFFLAEGEVQRSNAVDVIQNHSPYYQVPYATANQKDLRLGVFNNNIVNKSYIVAGYWDEETQTYAK